MPYKMHWEAKDGSGKQGTGPIVGKVEKNIFIPANEKEAMARMKTIDEIDKRSKHTLLEVLFTTDDLPELRKIHQTFFEAIGLTAKEKIA